jgi:hypothetical protein
MHASVVRNEGISVPWIWGSYSVRSASRIRRAGDREILTKTILPGSSLKI